LSDSGEVQLIGDRYSFSGREFPAFRAWCEKELGVDVTLQSPAQEQLSKIPEPRGNSAFLAAIKDQYKSISFDGYVRVFHSHGHTLEEIFALRNSMLPRVVDVVIWPGDHAQVEKIVRAAHEHNVVIIPFGGGTSVTNAVSPPEHEKRMIVSLDMHEMNKIKWIDRESMLCCIEAGAVGIELDQRLSKEGFTLGHEPDSFEFSTLGMRRGFMFVDANEISYKGGWISTNASGMKKNVYGNIEDIVISTRFVTPTGTLERSMTVPRMSSGPDLNRFVIGSEGTLGVVTEAVLRLRPLPAVREYGSIVFPDFDHGVSCLRELTRLGVLPASIRLVDNQQFQFGQVLKPGDNSRLHALLDYAKKFYVTTIKGFEVDKMTAVTLLFEGSREEVDRQSRFVYNASAKFGGLKGGEDNGKRGYFLTYMIAYLRDWGFNFWYIGESFETSVPWANVHQLVRNVKQKLRQSCQEKGIVHPPFCSARVTQCYETGCAVYFYFGFNYRGLTDPVACYLQIEEEARDEILANGGSLSHHHGIGKLRKKWVPQTLSETGVAMLQGVKARVDPKNIFACNNIVDLQPTK
jgi:alkyldihydroxyacetonephosphate synthase